LFNPTPQGLWFSLAVCSDSNSYGIQNGLIFSFPCCSEGDGDYKIIPDVPWNEYLEEKIHLSEQELIEEKSAVSHLAAKVSN
jgi:malate dehydrogenase (NADP+)